MLAANGGRMSANAIKTDWPGLISTLPVPVLAVAGLVSVALRSQWDDSSDWLEGLWVLALFEGVRIVVLRIMRDTFREYHGPWQAVKFFLLSLLILAAICFVAACFALGWRVFPALADVQTWRFVLPPLAIIVADGLVTLLFFRGEAQRVAAQLEALAEDADDWFHLAAFPLPIVVGMVCAAALLLCHCTNGARSVPDILREIGLLYAAAYFAVKAVLFAHVHTAHFFRTGRRLLGGGRMQLLVTRDGERARRNVVQEEKVAARRVEVFVGQSGPI